MGFEVEVQSRSRICGCEFTVTPEPDY